MHVPRILILEGSPRTGGNSSTLAARLADGARQAGAVVERVFLHGLNIRPCTACESCQGSLESDCVLSDDMQELYPKLRTADVLVYASPVYWFSVSAQLKLLMDRCFALTSTLPAADGGFDTRLALKGKRLAVILTYGDRDPFSSGAVNALRMFQDMARYCGMEYAGMVYGSALAAGEIAGNQELLAEAFGLGQRLAAP